MGVDNIPNKLIKLGGRRTIKTIWFCRSDMQVFIVFAGLSSNADRESAMTRQTEKVGFVGNLYFSLFSNPEPLAKVHNPVRATKSRCDQRSRGVLGKIS